MSYMFSQALLVVIALTSTRALHDQQFSPDTQPSSQFPDLDGLASVLESALEPYQRKYLSSLALTEGRAAKKINLLKTPRDRSAMAVWHAFESAMGEALDDPKLRLNADLGPLRNDTSIFVAISSYRDKSCSASVRNAFRNADRPELVNVGIVQQNCESEHAA